MAVGAAAPYGVLISKGESQVSIGRPSRKSLVVAVLSAVLLLAAIVATVGSFRGRSSSSLDESEEYLRVPRRLANLAADHDDREGLAEALRAGRDAARRSAARAKKQQQQHAQGDREHRYMNRRGSGHDHQEKQVRKEEIQEQRAKELNARDVKHMMSMKTMVPWVRWPKSDDDDTEFKSARKQQLLQMPMLMGSDVNDNAAKLLPLSEIMDRLKVDSKLHQGEVSDTQLAMADEKAAKQRPVDESTSKQTQLDCKPFC